MGGANAFVYPINVSELEAGVLSMDEGLFWRTWDYSSALKGAPNRTVTASHNLTLVCQGGWTCFKNNLGVE